MGSATHLFFFGLQNLRWSILRYMIFEGIGCVLLFTDTPNPIMPFDRKPQSCI